MAEFDLFLLSPVETPGILFVLFSEGLMLKLKLRLMLKLKLQYFGRLIQRVDSLEKDPDAGKD